MPPTRQPGDLTMERLQCLLDAYGAAPERWPDAEREAAARLIARSDAARARWEEAADVDRLLDTLPVDPPSPALTARVLAAAPRRRPRVWRRVVAVAVPLAAAAAVLLWLVQTHELARQVAKAPSVVVGEYTSPTDVLLEPYGLEMYATVPSIGCADSVLGCPNVNPADAPYSQRWSSGRLRA
jgi:hypothetical protein